MENINLIRKITWSFHHSTGHEWNDLFQEATLAYLEALETFDPDRGKMSTHAWRCITNHLNNYLRLEKHQAGHIDSLEDTETINLPIAVRSSFLDSLTSEAQVVANVVLRTSRKFCVLTTEEAEERIERVMLHQGWSIEKIHQGIADLKYACCESD
jgi:RNA polymerase sigma factor (sigma-70 family)